jgi:hypothetical protein
MTPPFAVRTTPRFERLARALLTAHPEFPGVQHRAIQILEADSYNHTRAHHLKKLVAVRPGEGQWRLSLGRFRFRHDIYGQEVVLHYCGLRRETTYQ